MRRARARAAAAALAIVAAAACHRADPSSAPLPVPPGEPPPVQAPVESAPTSDPGPPVPAAAAPRDPQLRRFEVVAVTDSTLTLLVSGERWVRRGLTGAAVDPRRRDALVARFRVIGRSGDSATALVTGQTTRLALTHVALLRQPVPGALRQDVFWAGLFFGLALGAASALLAKR